jgi:hypothetical protein
LVYTIEIRPAAPAQGQALPMGKERAREDRTRKKRRVREIKTIR